MLRTRAGSKRLTARENVAYFGRLHGMSEADIGERTRTLSQALEMDDILSARPGLFLGPTHKTAIARSCTTRAT